jgi:phage terminase small subunit
LGEIKIDIEAELLADNLALRRVDVQVFADALSAYQEVWENIRKNGTIVMHPRTGAPIKNPYLEIQTRAGETLTKMRKVKADRVLALLRKSV